MGKIDQEKLKAFICYHRSKFQDLGYPELAQKLFSTTDEYKNPELLRGVFRRCEEKGEVGFYTKKYDQCFEVSFEDLDQKLREHLLKNSGMSVLALADYFDVAPKIIDSSLKRLKSGGYAVKYSPPSEGIPSGKAEIMTASISPEANKFIVENNDDRVRFGVLADTHLGNKYQALEELYLAYEIFKTEGIKDVYHCGNLVDGTNSYPGQEFELIVHGATDQAEYVVTNYPEIAGIKTHFIASSTCHEGAYLKRMGLIFGKLLAPMREDFEYLGLDQADVLMRGKQGQFINRFIHPGGGSAYAVSYKSQKYIENLVDSLMNGTLIINVDGFSSKPSMVFIGHYHKMNVIEAFGTQLIQAGCVEYQTSFMSKRSLAAHVGVWIIEVLPVGDGNLGRIKYEWISRKRLNGKYFFSGV